jgi:Flp pilus assembly protein TadB
LATTLASVGRSIRDRIEIGRKVRSQTTQAQASVIGICAITYGLALVMWLQNEADFEAFAGSEVGTLCASMAILLQAAGLQWITRLSQLRF